MSRVYENEFAIYISHENFVNSVYNPLHKCINPNLFHIFHRYKQKKPNDSINVQNKNTPESRYENQTLEQTMVRTKFQQFMNIAQSEGIFENSLQSSEKINESALRTAQTIYTETGKEMVQNAFGSNRGPPVVKDINKGLYLFPQNSTFYAKNVVEINEHLKHQTFDLILLDPPWWNKYIRRKRKANSDGYDMMFNDDLKSLPVDKLLEKDGLVVVWCTNSEENFNHLVTKMFPKWNVEFVGTWYWLKVTTAGEPICDFSEPPGKQPYEKIVFGSRKSVLPLPQDGKLVISVPSALHSHKPPLVELLKQYLPEFPKCLEIFARYLVPEWTSYGNEVLRFQHESVYFSRTAT